MKNTKFVKIFFMGQIKIYTSKAGDTYQTFEQYRKIYIHIFVYIDRIRIKYKYVCSICERLKISLNEKRQQP